MEVAPISLRIVETINAGKAALWSSVREIERLRRAESAARSKVAVLEAQVASLHAKLHDCGDDRLQRAGKARRGLWQPPSGPSGHESF